MPAGWDNASADWNLRLRSWPPFEVACPLTVLAFSLGCRCLVMIAPEEKRTQIKWTITHNLMELSAPTLFLFLSPVSGVSFSPFYVPTIASRCSSPRNTTIKQHNWFPCPRLSIYYGKKLLGESCCYSCLCFITLEKQGNDCKSRPLCFAYCSIQFYIKITNLIWLLLFFVFLVLLLFFTRILKKK